MEINVINEKKNYFIDYWNKYIGDKWCPLEKVSAYYKSIVCRINECFIKLTILELYENASIAIFCFLR